MNTWGAAYLRCGLLLAGAQARLRIAYYRKRFLPLRSQSVSENGEHSLHKYSTQNLNYLLSRYGREQCDEELYFESD
jgi:hypothetical protein